MATAAIVAAIVIAVVAAAAASYATYSANQAAQQQAKLAKKAATQRAEAEAAAGAARRRQAELRAKRFQEQQRSRAGAAGVRVGEGSLLEGQMEAASLAEYDAQLAEYPHQLAEQKDRFEAKIFGFKQRQLQENLWKDTVISGVLAGGSSLASSYGKGSFSGGGGSGSDLTVYSAQDRGYTGFSGGGRN